FCKRFRFINALSNRPHKMSGSQDVRQEIVAEPKNHTFRFCLGVDKGVVLETCAVVFAEPSNYAYIFIKFNYTAVNTIHRDRLERGQLLFGRGSQLSADLFSYAHFVQKLEH